jgi:hypothetical protein
MKIGFLGFGNLILRKGKRMFEIILRDCEERLGRLRRILRVSHKDFKWTKETVESNPELQKKRTKKLKYVKYERNNVLEKAQKQRKRYNLNEMKIAEKIKKYQTIYKEIQNDIESGTDSESEMDEEDRERIQKNIEKEKRIEREELEKKYKEDISDFIIKGTRSQPKRPEPKIYEKNESSDEDKVDHNLVEMNHKEYLERTRKYRIDSLGAMVR